MSGRLRSALNETVKVTPMVFKGFKGDEAVHEVLNHLPGGKYGALFVVMLVLFLCWGIF